MVRIAIYGYKNNMVPPWDPRGVETGLPGSEEAVVYATQELANMGHHITVYMNPPKDSPYSLQTSNPIWVDCEYWDQDENKFVYDLVFMWRIYNVAIGKKRGLKVFFWPHDSPSNYLINKIEQFDGLCWLSKHHRQQYEACTGIGKQNIPYIISGNGIVPSQFYPLSHTPERNPYSIGYFSSYSRGLKILLSMWPAVHERYKDATLSIYYGRETWGTCSQEDMNDMVACIEKYKTIGVLECGKVGHVELANAMKNTSIWAYPCITDAETFCITAIKCQAAGCIPVTTRIGALKETIHNKAPTIENIRTVADLDAYGHLLLETLHRVSTTDVVTEREMYINFSKHYTWEKCVQKWMTLYQLVANNAT